MKILIVGATGMLGYSLFSNLSDYDNYDVYGTVRNIKGKENYFSNYLDKLIYDVDVNKLESLALALDEVKADVVINCIGLIKQYDAAKKHTGAISINSLLPHQLAEICNSFNARLIHFSTDCVFSGKKGHYSESDFPDAQDLYGKSKCLGEVDYAPHLTLRTSIIGHELSSEVSLVDWFLSQKDTVDGYSKAIFSGLPTCYVATLLADHIIPATHVSGLYQLSVEPIDKYSLLKLIAESYGKNIEINDFKDFSIDRSLDSSKLQNTLGLEPIPWPKLIDLMFADYSKRYKK